MSNTSSTSTTLEAAESKSTTTFLSALVVASTVAAVQLILFVVLRSSIKKIYAPRTYLPLPGKRAAVPSWALWGWVLPVIRSPARGLIKTAGLDAYMYLRYCKMMIHIFLPAVVVTWPVLLTLNALGTDSGDGLNRFTFGSISKDHQGRYWAHLICAYMLTFWVFYLIKREMSNYVTKRGAWLISKEHLEHPQARTVLVTGVPKGYLTKDAIIRLTAKLPGGVKRVWISRALGDLPDMYEKRLSACGKLESAETQLCKIAVSRHCGPARKGGDATMLLDDNPSLADRLVPRKNRPVHRLGFWGLWGKKVDTIDWCKNEISSLTEKLKVEREKMEEHPPHNSVFIEFNDQLAAHIFAQAVIHHQPLRMAKRYVDVAPDDVIYDNLNLNPYDSRVRSVVAWLIAIGLVVLWSFPVTLVGIVSNLTSLCIDVSWLSWLCRLPGLVQDVIQGILPPVALMLLFILLPIILRLLGRYSGIPRTSEVELSVMQRYFVFLVVHGFLITTLSSGLTVAIPQIIDDPSQAVQILGGNLPKASTFFATYVITKSLTGAAGALLQVVTLLLYYLGLFVFASTPREVFGIRYRMDSPAWGTLFPNTTLITVIGLAYTIIQPIMAGLCLLAFTVFWFAYKYLFLYAFDVPEAHETGGRFFPIAVTHVFIGLYICQLCLMSLFFLATGTDDRYSAIPQAALTIVLFIITVFLHSLIRSSYNPLVHYLPFSLQDKQEREKGEKASQTAGPASGDPREGAGKEDFEMQERGRAQRLSESAKGKGAPTVAGSTLAAPVGVDGDHERKETSEWGLKVEEKKAELGRNAFLHPSIWESTRPLWIPNDPLGLGKSEAADMKHRKIPSSTAGAGMSERGHVYVTRSPPENIEVIEMVRERPDGLFALPGAIGAGARRAAQRLGAEAHNLDGLIRRSSEGDRTRFRLGRDRSDRKAKPPRAGAGAGAGMRIASRFQTSDSEAEAEGEPGGRGSGDTEQVCPRTSGVDGGDADGAVAPGAELPAPAA